MNGELNIPVRQNGKLVTSEHPNPAGWPRGTEPLCPFVTLSKAGCTVLSSGRHSKSPAASNFREWCKPERKAKNASHFLRVWECLSIRPFSVLLVTNKQFFPFGRVHQTRLLSLNLLSQVSVLLRSLRSPPQNFDSPFGLPQDDQVGIAKAMARKYRKSFSRLRSKPRLPLWGRWHSASRIGFALQFQKTALPFLTSAC